MKTMNQERRARSYDRDFGPDGLKGDFVRGYPCDFCNAWPVEAAHAVPRSRGGDASVLGPLCQDCHRDYDEYRVSDEKRMQFAATVERLEAEYQEWLKARDPDGGLSF